MAEDFESKRKEAEAFAKSIEASRKSMEAFQLSAGEALGSLLNLSTSDFFTKIERSPGKMKELSDEARLLELSLIKSKTEMNDIFNKSIKNNLSTVDELREKIRGFNVDKENLEFIKMKQTLLESLKSVTDINNIDIAGWMVKNGDESHNFLNNALRIELAFTNTISNIAATEAGLEAVNEEMEKTTQLSFSLSKAFGKFVDRKFSVEQIVTAMSKFDEIINKATRETGILFDTFSNQAAFTNLTIQTAAYGKSVAETAAFMGHLGDKLNSTNFDLLAKAADDTKTFQYAIGLSNDSAEELTYNFMRMGKTSSQVKEFVQGAATSAGMLGLNVKKVVEDVSKNFPKFRQFGFQGGVESLRKMVETAQKLRLNIDEVFEMSKRARGIEGAMEMAAELQLAGGSFAQIDPMQLLAAARKSPAELTKILGQMGNDIGKFDEKTGEVKFDPVDADRLEMVSKATSLSVDSLMDTITKSKRGAKKENLLGSLFGQLDDKQKEFVQQFTEIGENGEITMTGSLKGLSVEELKSMNQSDIKKRMEMEEKNQKSLEQRAKENQAFTESLSNFQSVLLNFFTIFQPILDILTSFITTLTKFATEYKGVTYALIGGFLMFKFTVIRNMIGGFLSGFSALLSPTNLMGKIGGMFKGDGGSMFGGGSQPNNAGQGAGGGMFGNMSPKKIEALGNAAKSAAPGILALGAAFLMIGGGIALASLGLSELVESFSQLTGTQMIGALTGITLVMGGFVAMLYFLPPAITAIGAAGVFAAPGLLALGAAFLMIGGGVALASLGISQLVESFKGLDAKSLTSIGGALLSFAAGLGALSIASIAFANPIGLISLALMVGALASLSIVMSTLAPNLESGGKGMVAMAEGVERLSAALSSISDDALDKLKSIGENIGDAVALTAAVNALTTTTASSGKGGATQKFQIEVIVKNENGREIQRKILKDTDLLK